MAAEFAARRRGSIGVDAAVLAGDERRKSPAGFVSSPRPGSADSSGKLFFTKCYTRIQESLNTNNLTRFSNT